MSTLGTGTLGSGTLGNPGTVESSSGGGGRRRNLGLATHGPRLRRAAGHLNYRVFFFGFGRLETAGDVVATVTLSAPLVAAEFRSQAAVQRRNVLTLRNGGGRTYALTGAPEFHAVTAGHVTRTLRLTRISDPPDLWVLLDLPELS